MAYKREITLLSISQDPRELGLRYLSSVLKNNGYAVNKLFLKQRFQDDISSGIIEQISEFAKDNLFIGISIMTDYVILARNIAKKLKQVNKDLILVGGGVHPTLRPNEIIDVFDIAVRGEAEESILILGDELASGKEVKDIRIPGVSTKSYQSEQLGFIEHIDNLPYPDFCDNFIIRQGKIYLEKDYKAFFGQNYTVLTSRGCPYGCTYCVNNFYQRSIKGFFRKRGMDKVIDELASAKERYGIKETTFPSDNFLSFGESELDYFIQRYKKEINLPFLCCTTPSSVKGSHIDKLIKIGLVHINIGIESGSENTLNLYKRRHSNLQKIVEVSRILHTFSPKLNYGFDLILDNPYETEEDLRKTLALLEEMPKTYDRLVLFSLVFYPGTYLYDKAVEDGIIEDAYYLKKAKYIYKLSASFYNSIFLLYALKVNPTLIAYLTRHGSGKGMGARIIRAIIKNLTNVLLGATLLKKVIFSIRVRNKILLLHYIKFGLSQLKHFR